MRERKILTEAELRAARLPAGTAEYHAAENTFVTPSAREYLRDRGIRLVIDREMSCGYEAMTRTPIPKGTSYPFVDARTGEPLQNKSEEMTHLRGNQLVPKTHPRILLRGKLDCLQAEILLLQWECLEEKALCKDLESALQYVGAILGAEVKDSPLEDRKLFDLEYDEIRRMSHHVKEVFGMDHPIPNCRMGRTALRLNLLRTKVRETELAAAGAFPEGDSLGLIRALNRLSSGIYILFCRVLSGYYRGNREKNG